MKATKRKVVKKNGLEFYSTPRTNAQITRDIQKGKTVKNVRRKEYRWHTHKNGILTGAASEGFNALGGAVNNLTSLIEILVGYVPSSTQAKIAVAISEYNLKNGKK